MTSRFLYILALLAPSAVAFAFSIMPALRAATATILFSLMPGTVQAPALDAGSPTEIRRKLQQYFTRFEIYIPLDDIVIKDPIASFSTRGVELNALACQGDSQVSVWVPYRFRLPFAGEVVWERCWIPKYGK
jgi:hypothetical protein